ncbi:hypothetical protein [Egicoccus sp. AB-alg2]|uniref:hypothetical protein n=1 Tax=Egicoccus sp. AB-alg2 TaxID=3242693 RepID=UPI00359CCAE2
MSETVLPPSSRPHEGHVGLSRVLRAHLRLVVTLALLGALVGAALAVVLPTDYRAESTLYLADTRTAGLFASGRPEPGFPGSVAAVTDRARSASLSAEVAEQLGVSPDTVQRRVTVMGAVDDGGLAVSATAPTAEEANRTLDTFVATLESSLARDGLAWAERAAAELAPFQATLEERLAEVDEALAVTSAAEEAALTAERTAVFESLLAVQLRAREVATDAELLGSGMIRAADLDAEATPTRPGLPVLAAAGLLLGLLVGVAIAWRRMEQSPTVQDARDPATVLAAPHVGTLAPRRGQLSGRRRFTGSRRGRGLRLARVWRQLQLLEPVGTPTLYVRGVGPHDDAEGVAIAVAKAAARGGRRVLVCGVDNKRSRDRDRRTTFDESGAAQAFVVGTGFVRVVPSAQPPASSTADLVVVREPAVLVDQGPSLRPAGEPPHPVLLAVHRDRSLDDVAEAAELLHLADDLPLGYVYVDAPATPSWRRSRPAPSTPSQSAAREAG